MASQPVEPIRRDNTGGSASSQLGSRNPYRDSMDATSPRNPYWTPQESPSQAPGHSTGQQQQAYFHPQPSAQQQQQQQQRYDQQPTGPERHASQGSNPALPPRHSQQDDNDGEGERADSPHPGFTPPFTAFHDAAQQSRGFVSDEDFGPPRRRLTTGEIPLVSVGYTRNPERVIAYLIPLPAPMRQGQRMEVPQRYMIYTPPHPHLLKPEGKEGKRHKAKRLIQQEVKKAKLYEGKTMCIKGLHYKAVRGCDRAIAHISNPDIQFLTRIPRKQIAELVLIHPEFVLAGEQRGPQDVHGEFTAHLARTKAKARKHSAISSALFIPSLVIDTLAAVIWPFGGLAEIDGVWMYASIKGYLTARSVTKRLDPTPEVTEPAEQGQLRRALHGEDENLQEHHQQQHEQQQQQQEGGNGENGVNPVPRRETRQVHFQEELDEEDEKLKANNNKKKSSAGTQKQVKVRLVPDEAMETMMGYFQEICHRRNARAFPSAGVPPTKTDVLASIGWWPDRRGRTPGVEHEGDWDDENWQTREVKEDLDRVMKKAAKSWDKWCRSYAKYPQRAMKEKGHSRTSEVLRRLRLMKDTRANGRNVHNVA